MPPPLTSRTSFLLATLSPLAGELDVDVKMDVPVRKLAYDIVLDRPGREDIVLAITAWAGTKGLRIVEFSIERGILVKARGTSAGTERTKHAGHSHNVEFSERTCTSPVMVPS